MTSNQTSRRRRAFLCAGSTLLSLLAVTSHAQTAAPAAAQPAAAALPTAPAGGQAAESAAAPGADKMGLADIVVTAQRRSENLQKVPISVSAFDAKLLAQANIRDAADLGRITPGLVITRGDHNLTPFLRGIGSDVNTVGFESSVAVYVDGVYFPRLSPGFLNLTDIERVEVLKGPQGTLFGRNASGGLINIITSDPSLKAATGKASVSYGNYNILSTDAYVSLPISQSLAASLTVSRVEQGDGFGRNIITGNKTSYDNDLTLRGKMLFSPLDTTKIVLTGYYIRSTGSLQGDTYPGTTQGYNTMPFGRLDPLPGFYDQRGNNDSSASSTGAGASLRVEQQLGFAKLTSITSYQHIREKSFADDDYTSRNEFNADINSPVDTTSQEFQLASTTRDSFQWTTGLYYFRSIASYNPVHFSGLLFGEGVNIYGRQNSRSYAGYAQGTLRIAEGLSATLGGRYSHDDVSAGGRVDIILNGAPLTVVPYASSNSGSDHFSYRAALNYQATDDVLVYVSANRGYKTGTYSILPFSPTPAKAETLDAYEVGAKTQFLDRRVRLNAAIFDYEIKNPQVQILQASSALVSNAGAARVRGAEVQLDVQPASAVSLRFGATYLDAKYTKYGTLDPATGLIVGGAPSFPVNFSPPYGTQPAQAVNGAGNRLLHAPKFQFTVGGNYDVETSIGKLSLSADYAYTGDFFWEPDNLLKQPAYGLLGARARLALAHGIGVSIWGKNITNQRYVSFVNAQAGPAGYPYIAGAPRTYGGTVEFSF